MIIQYNYTFSSAKADYFQKKIAPLISFEKEYWTKQAYGKERRTYTKTISFPHKLTDEIFFLAGHNKRICKELGVEVVERFPKLAWVSPKLKGITLRPDQEKLVHAALNEQRGVILSGTGTGKTIVQLAICSAFKNDNILILAHTIDLIHQVYEKAKELGLDPNLVHGSNRKIADGITISTCQTFRNLCSDLPTTYFDVIIVDETHHVNNLESVYGEILTYFNCPCILGFTATLPTTIEKRYYLEGLIGSVIGKVKQEEIPEVLAKPRMCLIKLDEDETLRKLKYREVINKGIVLNRQRNEKILEIVKDHLNKKENVLIFVQFIDHLHELRRLAREKKIDIQPVFGDTDKAIRLSVKNKMMETKGMAVVVTDVWKEGINIPNLHAIVLGSTNKSSLSVIQIIGRGLRLHEGKSTVWVYDFFDNSNYFLVSHFGERLSLYFQMGWIGEN